MQDKSSVLLYIISSIYDFYRFLHVLEDQFIPGLLGVLDHLELYTL
jgi:hypothetical protein